jgi:PilZ domain
MNARYSMRTPVTGTAAIDDANGVHGQGRVLNLSVPGCLLETSLLLHVGQPVQLTMTFSDGKAMNVGLAVVRWIKERRAGMEFIRMSVQDQVHLRWACRFY